MKKQKISTIITEILFLVGLFLLFYPSVSNYWNSIHQSQAVEDYSGTVEQMDGAEQKQMFEAAEEYNQKLQADAGRFTPLAEISAIYQGLLDPEGSGMMGYITIPEIRCELPIYHSVEDSVLQVGIGHLEGSSLPTGGEGTHCVLSGHRGLPSAKLFTDLDRLEKGDIFVLHVLNRTMTYEIDQILIVEPEDYGPLAIEEGKDLCTLLTCTPYGINTQRLLVRGHRIENQEGMDARVTSDAGKVSSVVVAAVIGAILLVAGAVLVRILRQRKLLA